MIRYTLLPSTYHHLERILVEDLPHGLETTIFSSLRRIILSETPGYAIEQIKLHKAKYEYDNQDYLLENTSSVLQNISKVSLSNHSNVTSDCYKFKFKGPGTITSGHFGSDGQIIVCNEDQYICNVTTEEELDISFVVRHSYKNLTQCYSNYQMNNLQSYGQGYLTVRSVCNPIERVSCNNIEKGSISIAIKSRCAIDALAVVNQAAKRIKSHLEDLRNELFKPILKDNIDTIISDKSTLKDLRQYNVHTILELLLFVHDSSLDHIKKIGHNRLQEIQLILRAKNIL